MLCYYGNPILIEKNKEWFLLSAHPIGRDWPCRELPITWSSLATSCAFSSSNNFQLPLRPRNFSLFDQKLCICSPLVLRSFTKQNLSNCFSNVFHFPRKLQSNIYSWLSSLSNFFKMSYDKKSDIYGQKLRIVDVLLISFEQIVSFCAIIFSNRIHSSCCEISSLNWANFTERCALFCQYD